MSDYRHGHNTRKSGRSPTYRSWMAMRIRCNYKPEYAGVSICQEWNRFSRFISDMGERPDGMTLDRIDGRLGYSAANCRWASATTQSRNKVKLSGIQWATQQGKWKVNIGLDGKVIHLGYMVDWFEAVCLRKSAENKYWRSE